MAITVLEKWEEKRMQEQFISCNGRYEGPGADFGVVGTEAVTIGGLPCFTRNRLRGLERECDEDEASDAVQRTCVLMGPSTKEGEERLEKEYVFAGISLWGETMGRGAGMNAGYKRALMSNFVNTGASPIEAGDDVYYVLPSITVGKTIGRSGEVAEGVARTTGLDGFEQHLKGVTEDKELYRRRHFMGRCMLGAESGKMGALVLSG